MSTQPGPTPAPFFCLARAAWIPYAFTRDLGIQEAAAYALARAERGNAVSS
jgi:hypothetical protein